MSNFCQEEDDYTEYDEEELFREYLEIASGNFDHPKLKFIEAILEKKGFHITVEQVNRKSFNNATGAGTVKLVVNIRLKDTQSGEPVKTLMRYIFLAPVIQNDITPYDIIFLRTAQIRW